MIQSGKSFGCCLSAEQFCWRAFFLNIPSCFFVSEFPSERHDQTETNLFKIMYFVWHHINSCLRSCPICWRGVPWNTNLQNVRSSSSFIEATFSVVPLSLSYLIRLVSYLFPYFLPVTFTVKVIPKWELSYKDLNSLTIIFFFDTRQVWWFRQSYVRQDISHD